MIPALGLAVVVGLVLIVGYEIEDRVCSKIRGKDPDLWRELGSPDRHFGDFGMAKRAALRRLSREPALLQRCGVEIAHQVRFSRSYAKGCAVLAWVALAALLTYSLAQL